MGHFLQVGLFAPNLQRSSLATAYCSNSLQEGHKSLLPSIFLQYRRIICSTTCFSSFILFIFYLKNVFSLSVNIYWTSDQSISINWKCLLKVKSNPFVSSTTYSFLFISIFCRYWYARDCSGSRNRGTELLGLYPRHQRQVFYYDDAESYP